MEDILRLESKVDKLSEKLSHMMNTFKAYQRKDLNMAESAAYLGIEISTLRNLCSSRKIIGFKRGKFRYFKMQELEEYLSGE